MNATIAIVRRVDYSPTCVVDYCMTLSYSVAQIMGR